MTVKASVVQKYFRYYIAKESLKVFRIDQYPWFYCLKEQREMLEGFIRAADKKEGLHGSDYFEVIE